jgi:L,D-transpeptidase catalytic domain
MLSQFSLAQNASDVLWEKLNADFESKAYFFNSAMNDERDNVMSPFITKLFGEYATNNARPLTPQQLNNLPEGRFLDKEVLRLAMAGRERLLNAGKIKNNPIMAVVNFSLNSKLRRLYILDVEKGEVLINFYVAHGVASDKNKDGLPETFSNRPGSNMSSLGFMVSENTYSGSYGYSLRLRGLDSKLNSNVMSRAVVLHGFGGIGPQQASWGYLSTSEGCLMVSMDESGRFWGMEDKSMLEIVIDQLKSGSLIFTYSDEVDEAGKELIYQSNWIKESDLL